MKSWIFLFILITPLVALSQSKKPLSARVEELLKKKNEKRAREAQTIEEIRKDAMLERLENERQKKIKNLQAQKLSSAIKSRFVPKTPFLNFRPLKGMALWKTALSYSVDSFKTTEDIYDEGTQINTSVKKEFKKTHLKAVNEFHYSWSKKLLFKYINTYHFSQMTRNDKRAVSITDKTLNTTTTSSPIKDPELKNGRFGDHVIEVNYRKHREIFYGHDLDYYFRLVHPFGQASRAGAFSSTTASYTASTTASQDGNLKSPFAAKPVFGLDYFTGKDESRYGFGGNIGYALSGSYINNKGNSFFSSTRGGLTIDTEKYLDSNFWFKYQIRPKALEKTFYGFGIYGYFTMQQKEKLNTTASDGLSWVQKNTIKAHYRFSVDTWVKYMLKKFQHIEVKLKAYVPYSYKIQKRIVDEGSDTGGNRQFFGITQFEEVENNNPIEVKLSYVYSF